MENLLSNEKYKSPSALLQETNPFRGYLSLPTGEFIDLAILAGFARFFAFGDLFIDQAFEDFEVFVVELDGGIYQASDARHALVNEIRDAGVLENLRFLYANRGVLLLHGFLEVFLHSPFKVAGVDRQIHPNHRFEVHKGIRENIGINANQARQRF